MYDALTRYQYLKITCIVGIPFSIDPFLEIIMVLIMKVLVTNCSDHLTGELQVNGIVETFQFTSKTSVECPGSCWHPILN